MIDDALFRTLDRSPVVDFAYQYTLKNRIVSRLKKLFVKEKK